MQRYHTILLLLTVMICHECTGALPITDGLVLHLDVDAITGMADGATLSQWDDLSGMGNHATQAVQANQPVYLEHSSNFFDLPAVRFDGVHWMALPPTTVTVGSFTMLAVGRYNFTENNQYIVAGQDGSGNDRIRLAWDNATANTVFEYRAGSTSWLDITAPADTLIHVFGITSTVEGFLDGVSLGTSENSSNESPTAFNIGSYNRGEKDYFNGELAELVIYNRVLSSEEIALLSEYLRVRTNLSSVPDPADGAVDVSRDIDDVSWTSGEKANSHRLYFGTDFNDVNSADTINPREVLIGELDENHYVIPELLDFNQPYYWRVDEVNDVDPNSPWKGRVWRFTTADFLYVDAFEDYNDVSPYRVFEKWLDGWDDETNGAVVGYAHPDLDAGEHYIETEIIHGGAQSMPYFYDTDMKSSEAVLPMEADAGNWTLGAVDEFSLWFLGYLGEVGSFVEAPAGTFTITAAGTDIFGDSDEFHFAYKEVSGGISIIAKVESLENTDPFAKAGIMIRDTLEPEARNVALLMTPAENGLRYQYRTANGGDTDRVFDANLTIPYWVRVERTTGGLVRAFHSPDGTTWTPYPIRGVTMDQPVYIGLAVTSHNATLTTEAVFSNVTLSDNAAGVEWAHQDVGILSNDPEPLYVALNGSPVYYSDPNTPDVMSPNATQMGTWTQWRIPLADFSEQGVDLTQVEHMTIGVGVQGDTSTPGGQGLLYFDDIHLNRP